MRSIDADTLVAELKWLQSQVSSTSAMEIAEYIDRINAQPTVDAAEVVRRNWIPASERKPHYGQEVIVYGGNYLKACVTTMRFWDESHVNWVGFTHWMPLPEPPKEELHET